MSKLQAIIASVWCVAASVLAAPEPPLLYVPFDGRLSAAVSAGPAAPVNASDGMLYVEGVRGQAVRINADCRFSSKGNFRQAAGTVAFWLRPQWAGGDARGKYLFCLYGGPDAKPEWMHNRWSLVAGSGRLRLFVLGAKPRQRAEASASIQDWQPGQWHHVAATWSGFNSGRGDGQVRLYLDGRLAGESTKVRMDIGQVAERLDVGRDSDGSPNYADADYDDFYIYGRALTQEQIQAAVQRAQSRTAAAAEPVPPGKWSSRWWDSAWRCRCRVEVDVGEGGVAARLPLDVQDEAASLGLQAAVDVGSLRLVPCDARTAACAAEAEPVPVLLEGRDLLWRAAPPKAGQTRAQYQLYFGLARVNTSTPLFVRKVERTWPRAAGAAKLGVPDYAADTYGDAWDFDEGDFEGIDQWGNRPSCLRNRKVGAGVLSFDVSEDPWFIWGNMWGQVGNTERPVRIDLERYPVLRVRVRQSCSAAQWELYGRVGPGRLRKHEFTVRGQGWQVVRVDLHSDARWRGVLTAFRIDPTAHVKDARVEIDWVRLTRECVARRSAVEVLGPPAPEGLRLGLAVAQTAVQVASTQTVTATATDRAGAPAPGLPVTVRLRTRGDAALGALSRQRTLRIDDHTRRGVTDERGRVAVTVRHSRSAARTADTLDAAVDFTQTQAEAVAVDCLPGPAHHYRVSPVRPQAVAEGQFPLPVTVQIVDQHDNPLPIVGRRVTLSAPAPAALAPAQVVTDARGRAKTTLRVDPAKRWVYWVEARDANGLEGRSGKVSVVLAKPRANPVGLLPSGYFAFADGRPFVPLGGFYANWVQSETEDGEWSRLRSFTDTTDEDKRQWMRFLSAQGVTAMRFMLRTHRSNGMEPMDVGGRANPALFAEALRYMDLAREFGLMFQLVVHEDYTKPMYYNAKALRLFALPQFAGVDLDRLPAHQRRFVRDQRLLVDVHEKYTDPDAMACQDMYAKELAGALRGNPQVFAYELENEMVACPAVWANHATGVLRSADPATLVCASHGGGGLATADPLWWRRQVRTDFYNYHLYPHGRGTSPEIDYGAAVDVLTRYGRMAGNCMMGESAGDQFRRHPSVEARRWTMRDIIWMGLTSGDPGVFFWNARGSEVREFRLAKDAMERLDLRTFRRGRPDIGVDVTHPLDDDHFFRGHPGQAAYAMMGRYAQHFLSQGVDFDFTVSPNRYKQVCRLDAFGPPRVVSRPVGFGPGWQLKFMARPDWSEALVYVRNFAGIEPWDCMVRGTRPWRQYLRTRKPAALALELRLPEGTYQWRIYDLDAQTVGERVARHNETLSLGVTDHDFAMVVKRRPRH